MQKRLSAAAAAAHNSNSETVQQQHPIAKRRKFIPTAVGDGSSGNSNAGNAYNSPGPGPSSSNSAGAHLNNHNNNSNNHHNSDSNTVGGEDQTEESDLYPATLLDGSGMLKYDPDEELQQGSDGDGGMGIGDGLMMGDDEDDYRNDCSEDGDNSMQDYSGMEQGAIGEYNFLQIMPIFSQLRGRK